MTFDWLAVAFWIATGIVLTCAVVVGYCAADLRRARVGMWFWDEWRAMMRGAGR